MNINWHLIIKIATGLFILPIALTANKAWPWWEKASLPWKIVTAPIILPLAGIAYATSFWWNDYK